MKLLSVFKSKEAKKPFQWASCKHPKTHSFRAEEDMLKTLNSRSLDPSYHHHHRNGELEAETPESTWFTNSSESYSSDSDELEGQPLEMVVRGARSDRLFFEGGDTSSILDKAKSKGEDDIDHFSLFKESTVVMAMESKNPYVDFKRSMEEMVECHGIKDWEVLEMLLGWYLSVNGKNNHGFIVGAFVDLLVDHLHHISSFSCSREDHDSASYASAQSSFSASSTMAMCCSLQDGNGIE